MKRKKPANLLRRVQRTFHTDDVFWKNEIEGNQLVALIMICLAVLLGLVWTLNLLGVFQLEARVMNRIAGWGLVELLVPVIVCRYYLGEKRWLKYVMMVELVIVLARIDSLLTFNVPISMALAVVLSVRYFSRSFTAQIAALSAVLFAVSAYCGARFGIGLPDMNYYYAPETTTLEVGSSIYAVFRGLKTVITPAYVRYYMLQSFLPKFMTFTVISIACAEIAKRGHNMVLEQAAISSRTARIDSELSLAADIQAQMLPSIFPPFPECPEFDLYATMDPAKEVGGDFYDFFMVDKTHLGIVIADVSGKGVPAALFMVIAKTLIKDHAQLQLEPGEVFIRANKKLCEGNEAGLFVTAWMAVLDLETGKLTFVNAGHNPPLLKRAEEGYTYLKTRPGFVLAGMEGMRYRQAELQLQPGDRLFLYTDGVTEATNGAGELFGETRLNTYLNLHSDEALDATLKGLRQNVDAFVGNAEQFDDITMLILEYRGTGGTQ